MSDEIEQRRAQLLSILPEGWDFHRDMLLILGSNPEEVAQHYRSVGQERILIALPEDSADPVGLPEDIFWFAIAAVSSAVRSIGHGIVEHVWFVRTDDPNVTPELVAQVREEVRQGLRYRAMNLGTIHHFGRTWLLQGIQNLPDVASRPSIASLEGAFPGRPAVLVSPGPSLSKQLELLSKLEERAVVIAGSHALHALQSAGVRVDVAMIIDAGDKLLRHFDGLDFDSIGALVATISAQREILELPFARKFLVSINGPLDGWAFEGIGEPGVMATGGSVSCGALALALKMGCDPIVLVGQDLAFSGGRFYAQESLDGNAMVEQRDGKFFLKKPDGAEGPGVDLDEGGDAILEGAGRHRTAGILRRYRPELRVHAPVSQLVRRRGEAACRRGTLREFDRRWSVHPRDGAGALRRDGRDLRRPIRGDRRSRGPLARKAG